MPKKAAALADTVDMVTAATAMAGADMATLTVATAMVVTAMATDMDTMVIMDTTAPRTTWAPFR